VFQSLHLNGCHKITDTGVASLAALSSLQSLDLSYCSEITDTGVASLAALSPLRIDRELL
jgi:F-box/leucine-rich repeat protein 14